MKTALAGAFGRAAAPLCWYYAIAVAVPVLNGAPLDGAFLEHVFFVVAVPLALLAAAGVTKVVLAGRAGITARRDT
jgi:hypothetical protein